MILPKGFLLVVLLATSFTVSCHGASILGIFPSPYRSHMITFETLAKELVSRGHHLTVISSFPQETPIENYRDIPVQSTELTSANETVETKSIFHRLLSYYQQGNAICENFLANKLVQQLIVVKYDHFDLVLIEVSLNECLLGFSYIFRAPVVGLSTPGGTHWLLDNLGNPNPYAYVPNHALVPYTDHMTFYERLTNTATTMLAKLCRDYIHLPSQDSMMRQNFDYKMPYITEIEKNTSLLLLNSQVTLGYPRPHLPNIIEVGGLHIPKIPNKLPQTIQKYLDQAKEGVIYFSFGDVSISNLLMETQKAFLEAFSTFKLKVLWSSDEDNVTGRTKNVKNISEKVPQASILAHPNVKLFITHMDVLSWQNSVYYAVPIVGIPIETEDEWNINKALELGVGVKVAFHNITTESIQWAIKTVLNDKSFRLNMKRASDLFKDQPTTPLQQAVYWTEYIIRHKGAPHLRSAALTLQWYEYWYLDLVAILAFSLLTPLVLFHFILKRIATKTTHWKQLLPCFPHQSYE